MLFGLFRKNIQIVDGMIIVSYGFPLRKECLEIPINQIESAEIATIKKKYKIGTTFGNRTEELDVQTIKIILKDPISGLNEKQIQSLTRNVAVYENLQLEKDMKTIFLLKEPAGGFDSLIQTIKKEI